MFKIVLLMLVSIGAYASENLFINGAMQISQIGGDKVYQSIPERELYGPDNVRFLKKALVHLRCSGQQKRPFRLGLANRSKCRL
jgi:hypothetical protein